MNSTALHKQLDAYGVPATETDKEGDTVELPLPTRISWLGKLVGKCHGQPVWIPPGAHFVLVVEDDRGYPAQRFTCDPYGCPVPLYEGADMAPRPITWEHEIGRFTSLEEVKRHRDGCGQRYGRTAIARLVFDVVTP